MLNNKVDEELITEYWNEISKQSERQLGAYIMLFINNFNQSPKIPNNDYNKFRNNVIHKGIIPTEQKALKIGKYVCDLIVDSPLLLKESFRGDLSISYS